MVWLAYVRGIYARSGVCEIRENSSFLAAPPRPYMGDEVSGSGPSRLQVYANPNQSWTSWASSIHLVLGL
jgi:hypothetical protein